MSVQLGTVDFYGAVAELLEGDPVWAEKGHKISYSLVFVYEPPVEGAVFLSFDEGRMTDVRDATPVDRESADFVISGSSDAWRAVCRNEMAPTVALTKQLLQVQGKMSVLLRNMAAFQCVFRAMTRVEFE